MTGRILLRALALALAIAAPLAARAEETTVRFAQQFGLGFLPLRVAAEHKLIEKHAEALGLHDVKVELYTISSGTAVNDALISGSVDIAMAGSSVLLMLWDKTRSVDPIKGMMAIADPRVHTILSSYDVVGGRHTLIVAYARQSWHDKNPKLYEATYRGLSEAIEIINADKPAAARLFLETEKSSLNVDQVLAILADEAMIFYSPTPTRVMPFADYMVKNGMLKNRPSAWTDIFFSNVHGLNGS